MSSPDDLSDLVQRIRQQPEGTPSARVPEPQLRRRPARASRRKRRTLIAIIVAAVIVVGGGAGAWAGISALGNDDEQQASAEQPKQSDSSPAADSPDSPDGAPAPVVADDDDAAANDGTGDDGDPAAAEEETGDGTETGEQADDPAESGEETVPTAEPSAAQYDIDSPDSLQVVVNKHRPLPEGWMPDDLVDIPGIPNPNGQPLRAEAADHLVQMHDAAVAAGVPFTIASAFRSYDLQIQLFNNYSANDGVEAAETYSARPGHSEHQTGLAVDIAECDGCSLKYEFGDMPQGQWAGENAYKFGFILRYNEGAQPTVGYVYEPWHFRYVGVEIATEMHDKGILNLEDYFGLEPAPTY